MPPSKVTVITGSIIKVNGQLYQISGMRTPRIQRAQCFYEKRRGRAAQRALRRVIARGPVQITPTGATNLRGFPFVNISVKGVDARQAMISRGFALARTLGSGPDRHNPWCVQP